LQEGVQHPDRHSNVDQEGGVAVLQSSEDTKSPPPPPDEWDEV
jgi:hypothetical protein